MRSKCSNHIFAYPAYPAYPLSCRKFQKFRAESHRAPPFVRSWVHPNNERCSRSWGRRSSSLHRPQPAFRKLKSRYRLPPLFSFYRFYFQLSTILSIISSCFPFPASRFPLLASRFPLLASRFPFSTVSTVSLFQFSSFVFSFFASRLPLPILPYRFIAFTRGLLLSVPC